MVQAVRCFHRVAATLPDGRALAVCALPGFHHELVLHPAHGKAVIVALLHKADEVIAGLRGLFREEHRPENTRRGIEHRNRVPCCRVGELQLGGFHRRAADALDFAAVFLRPQRAAGKQQHRRKTDCPEFFQHTPAPCSIYCTTTLHSAAQKIQPVVYHILRGSARGNCVKIYPMISVRKSILTNCAKHATL